MKAESELLDILRKIYYKNQLSQRKLAKDLGFSLGKLNYCLKALKNKGLIKIKNFKNNKKKINYIYKLTPKGISHKTKLTLIFMKRKMMEYDELKKEVDKETDKDQLDNAVREFRLHRPESDRSSKVLEPDLEADMHQGERSVDDGNQGRCAHSVTGTFGAQDDQQLDRNSKRSRGESDVDKAEEKRHKRVVNQKCLPGFVPALAASADGGEGTARLGARKVACSTQITMAALLWFPGRGPPRRGGLMDGEDFRMLHPGFE